MAALIYTIVPITAALAGALVATLTKPSAVLVSAIQHFAAGVIFAAAAGEILPDVMHGGSAWPTVIGGTIGVAVMLLIKQIETYAKGAIGLLTMVGIDLLIDGLVLGVGFVAGASTGMLLTIALTLEALFPGLTVTNELTEFVSSRLKVIAILAGLLLLLPVGAILAAPVAMLPKPVIMTFFAFGLIALLYLVIEELLVEAHETPDRPWVAAMFFAGFLILLVIEELMS
ncbi:MAG: transporter [Rhodospirillales bacterium]|nr:transporter [Rhodospirillales bacterium]